MSKAVKRRGASEAEPVRILGRGLRAQRGVHLTIRAVREAVGKTQVEVAADSAIDQSDVSRLESRRDFEDCLVSTLRRYVTALGGELELVASFGDRKIILAGIQSSTEGGPPDKNYDFSGALRNPYAKVLKKQPTRLAEGSLVEARLQPDSAKSSRAQRTASTAQRQGAKRRR